MEYWICPVYNSLNSEVNLDTGPVQPALQPPEYANSSQVYIATHYFFAFFLVGRNTALTVLRPRK